MSQAGLIDIEGSHPQIPTSFITNDGIAIPINNELEILGTVVAAHDIPLRTTGSGNTVTVETQYSSSNGTTDANKAGLASFDSRDFSVDTNGFVSLLGGGQAVDSFQVQQVTAPGLTPVTPDANGLVTVSGAAVANHSVVLETRSRALNTYNLEIQYATNSGTTDATKSGVAHFNSNQFTVDANGFVSLAGGGLAIDSITPNSGTSPIFPDATGNVSIVGTATNGIQAIGSLNTLTIGMNSPYGDGNFAFSRSASGSTNVLTVANTSNTSSSNALQQVTVAGTSAGDPVTTHTISGTANWTMGLDNSVSGDPFVMANSTALGTSNYMSVVRSSGYTTFSNLGANTPFRLDWVNSDTGASADSGITSAIAATSLTADPYLQTAIPAVCCYSWGIDNSDSDSLKITQDANNATPSIANVFWKMTSGGVRTMPLQPAFLAYLNAVQSNVTGDGTVYTVPFNTEVFDRSGNFSSNTFTAPVTGVYQFYVTVTAANIVAGNTDMIVNLVTTGRTFQLSSISAGKTFETQSGSSTLLVNGGIITAMTAGDTATVTLTVFGGTKTVGAFGNINGTNFSGCLLF